MSKKIPQDGYPATAHYDFEPLKSDRKHSSATETICTITAAGDRCFMIDINDIVSHQFRPSFRIFTHCKPISQIIQGKKCIRNNANIC